MFQEDLHVALPRRRVSLYKLQRLVAQEGQALVVITVEHPHFLKLFGLESDQLHGAVQTGYGRVARSERVLADVVKHGFGDAHVAMKRTKGKPATRDALPVLVQIS